MILEKPILLPYKTLKVVPRDGLLGFVAKHISANPILAGFVGGMLVALIAFARSPKVLQTAPAEAVFLGLAVVTAWVVLFRMMQPFFASLTVAEVAVVRAIAFDGDVFRAYEGETIMRELVSPRFRLVVAEAPPAEMIDKRRANQAWRAYLVVENDEANYVVETRLTASEASSLPVASVKADELLPTPVLSVFLEMARHGAPALDDPQ